MTDDLIPEALAMADLAIEEAMRDHMVNPRLLAASAVRAYLNESSRLRRESIQDGIERARKHGTRSGKPIGRPPLDKSKVAAIARDIASGDHTLAAIAMRYRIGEATVRRIRDGKHV